MAFAKNYIVNFTIPELSEEEKAYLLESHTREELNEFVWEKYRKNTIKIQHITKCKSHRSEKYEY